MHPCYEDQLNLWLSINNKISKFGFDRKDFKLEILPRESCMKSGLDIENNGWLNRGVLLGVLGACILLTIFACIAVKKEKKKKHMIKGNLRNVNKKLRAQVMDLKYRSNEQGFSQLGQDDFLDLPSPGLYSTIQDQETVTQAEGQKFKVENANVALE